jgi:hypothetical protein
MRPRQLVEIASPATAGGLLASLAMRLVAVCALAGCGYKPGSYASMNHRFAGQRVTVGCLDLAIARHADTPDGVVVVYEFGNRCDRPSPVEIPTTITGKTPGGKERALFAFDPNAEIRPLSIDGKSFGSETIEYRADDDYGSVDICLDAAAIAHQTPPNTMCLGDAPR